MKNKHSVILALLALGSASLHAVNFEFAAVQNSGFASADGIDLSVGSFLRFGSFDIADAEIIANADNLAFLDSHFIEIATATIGQNIPPEAEGGIDNPSGLFTTGRNDVNTTSTGLNIADSYLVYWVFNAPSLATATQHGIFSSTTWQIPSGDGTLLDTGPAVATDITDLTVSRSGLALADTANILVGSFGPGTNFIIGGTNFTLAEISPIPEPATIAALFGAVALGLVFWRRKVPHTGGAK